VSGNSRNIQGRCASKHAPDKSVQDDPAIRLDGPPEIHARGAELVGKTGAAREQISPSINEITRPARQILSAAEYQVTGLTQVNVATGEIDKVTRQNGVMVKERGAASKSLAGEAIDLAGLVDRLGLDRETARHMPRQPRRRPAPSENMLTRISKGNSRAFRSPMLRRENLAVGMEDWSEF